MLNISLRSKGTPSAIYMTISLNRKYTRAEHAKTRAAERCSLFIVINRSKGDDQDRKIGHFQHDASSNKLFEKSTYFIVSS